MDEKYVVTITRQFGSLGRPIAKKLAEKLGIEYYDRDIVEETARSTGIDIKVISNEEETAKNRFWRMKFPLGTPASTNEIQDHIFQVESDIIQDLASKESCIVVGRCAEYVLRHTKNCIRVYIYANDNQRLMNCVNVLHLDPQTAKRMMKEVDEARDAYHIRYAGFFPNDEMHKDILLNSGFLGVDGSAEVLAEMVRKKLEIGDHIDLED